MILDYYKNKTKISANTSVGNHEILLHQDK